MLIRIYNGIVHTSCPAAGAAGFKIRAPFAVQFLFVFIYLPFSFLLFLLLFLGGEGQAYT